MTWLGRALFLAAAGLGVVPPRGDLARDEAWARAMPEAARPGVVEPGALTVLSAPTPSMLLVRGSEFLMGSTGDEVVAALADCRKEPRGAQCEPTSFSDETPVRSVRLSAFWLDATEVTVVAYSRCVAAQRCAPLPLGQGARRFARPDYPATLVTWNDARDYCAFRGMRLPTEAEFERAARGTKRRRFPWGSLYHSKAANHGRLDWDPTDGGDGARELAPVGSYPAGRTPEGFLDLAGNVAEWVQDRYLPEYSPSDVKDPLGPPAGAAFAARVVRGGGYDTAAPWLRGAARSAADPSHRRPSIGFRCAKPHRSPRPVE